MAIKFSELPEVTSLTGGEIVALSKDDAGTLKSKKMALSVLKTWLSVPENATEVPFDNTASALTATDVQAAIDELAAQPGGVTSVDNQTGDVDLSGSYEAKRQSNLTATTDPTATDDTSAGYEPLSRWINTTTGEIWLCVDATTGAANWQKASLTLDELGSAAVADVGTGASQLPRNSDLGSAATAETTDFEPSGSVSAHEQAADPHSQYVQKVTGKTLSSNDYTDAEKSKLAGIEPDATGDQTKADIDALGINADTVDGKHAIDFDPAGTASSAVATHEQAADPHSQYVQKPGINNQTGTAYTLVLTDDNKMVRCNNAGAITVTVPTNATEAFPVGSIVQLRQVGAGQITVAPDSGVTINTAETLKSRKQGSTLALMKVAQDEWDLTGDVEMLP